MLSMLDCNLPSCAFALSGAATALSQHAAIATHVQRFIRHLPNVACIAPECGRIAPPGGHLSWRNTFEILLVTRQGRFMKRQSLEDAKFYFNRHLQWLAFNQRVLEEARDHANPLLERVKFLAITANNLDEFVEIRVSSFLQRIEHGSREVSPDGLTTVEELEHVSAAMQQFVRDQYKCWNDELLPQLAKENIRVLSLHELDGKAAQTAKTFYDRRVSPM